MPQPLDPAVQSLIDRTPRTPFVLPDPPATAAELALAIRADDGAAAPAAAIDFDGAIAECVVPVRWGSVHHEYPTHFFELGVKKAKEFLWTGDFVDAETALRLGMVNHVVPRSELETATRWLAERIALNDLLSLKLSKMSVNQAADIMGQSAAVRASGNFWLLSHSSRREIDGNNRVDWSKRQNERCSAHERASPRPWKDGN